MDNILAVLDRLLGWIERYLPGLIVSFGLGAKLGDVRRKRLVAQLDKAMLQLLEYENEKDVDIENAGKSPGDIIDDAIREISKR